MEVLILVQEPMCRVPLQILDADGSSSPFVERYDITSMSEASNSPA